MGVFGGLFGGKGNKEKKEEKSIPWIALTSLEQLEEIEKKSLSKPQFIFKHSTTCGISRMVINMFKSSYELTENQADLYYLDLHAFREVSNEVGYRFQVMHQSPQLLVIKNGTTVAHSSHGAIAEIDVQKFI
ncbi:bacillithiol system redox-active protein YtxJ [Maribacter algarum]|uniref:Bacillithiol system redox-active protein YtxJ n=1 Tax=Maribacter algarum (ex Zhang et al. 2020) TaxID=2578118 RepID=A0A5S3PQJ1_9FLAO|nr:bacillithiol system redox-active protein YtxJ [Maribacter algarum]TMM56931.1 bacillithiol system redox-active protein YtxJ [Maribacter algarum]